MAEKLGLAQSNVSQHLTILKNAGIIEGYRKVYTSLLQSYKRLSY